MNIYQISFRDRKSSEHTGYEYTDSKREAEQLVETHNDEEIEVEVSDRQWYPVTREGMLRALNHFGRHPDNE